MFDGLWRLVVNDVHVGISILRCHEIDGCAATLGRGNVSCTPFHDYNKCFTLFQYIFVISIK